MSQFRVGQRVKKVRGNLNIGYEGVVCGYVMDGSDRLLEVEYERPWVNNAGDLLPASLAALGNPDHYEPINNTPACADILALTRLPEGPVRVGEEVRA